MSSSEILIKRMIDSDLQIVMTIEEKCYPNPWLKEIFIKALSLDEYRAYVCELENKIIGYTVFWCGVNEVHLLNLTIDTTFQHHGYGAKLLEFVINYFPKEDFPIIILEVRTDNKSAIALYESHGFQGIGFRRRYYSNGDDALVMTLNR